MYREVDPSLRGNIEEFDFSIPLLRMSCIGIHCTVLYCTESVPRQEEGSTGKFQHEVEGTLETKCWYFPVLPDSSQGTDIIQFIKVVKL